MDLHLRGLELGDLDKGIIELLGQLTVVGDADRKQQEACINELLSSKEVYKVIVVEDKSRAKVVSTAKLLIERKLTRGCGRCGHIEDVVVDNAYRANKLGKRMIEALIAEARARGCYKVILNCSESNTLFYEKCGLKQKEVQMVLVL